MDGESLPSFPWREEVFRDLKGPEGRDRQSPHQRGVPIFLRFPFLRLFIEEKLPLRFVNDDFLDDLNGLFLLG